MRQAFIVAVVGVLLMAGAFGRDLPNDVVKPPHRVVGDGGVLTTDSTQTSAVNEILVTAGNQILVELAPGDSVSPNLFDLNERTVVFTPDGTGQYSREVKALEWEEEIGEEVEYSAVIMLESFDFPFAGHRWDSFFLGPPGVLTFGGQFTYSIPTVDITMKEIADKFISIPTISTLYNPRQIGVQARRIARRTDRIVVTEFSIEPYFMVHGVQPEKFARFQTVLGADGSIKFNYTDVPYGDGIVGFFQDVDLTERLPAGVDLSQSDNQLSNRHHEVFHYRDLTVHTYEIACRLIDFLGEEFDLFVFHREFRLDSHWWATPWSRWNFSPQGSGGIFDKYVPCGEGRLKGHWGVPIWMKSWYVFDAYPFLEENERFNRGLYLFAHEFAHSWLAYSSYDKSGKREPLYRDRCRCHWRWDLHAPAAFPWHGEAFGSSSIMGGYFWQDHGQGRFTLHTNSSADGFSWLDLYGMGLADADEVPDMFIVRNLQKVDDPNSLPIYTGEKEIVSIDQIVAAEGPRVPGTTHSQKVFNAGFVYLLEPGQTPSGDLLDLHARYRDKAVEYWSHITGGRSQITTAVPRIAKNRPPAAIGTIKSPPLTEDGTVVEVEVRDSFNDSDGDPLTYEVTSSDDEVAAANVSGSIVTIKPGASGSATVTVTAKDGRGGLAYQTIAIVVDREPEANPTDFTFVPVILSAEGRNNAYFTSELTLTNRGTELATLDFTYTAHIGGGSGTVREYLKPGRQRIVPNMVEFLRERGLAIPDAGNRIGTLRVASPRLDSSDLGVTVRTTTEVPEGRAGLAYPGIGVEAGFEDAVYVCGLRQNEQDRSNVSLQHVGTPEDGPITLRATVFSGDPEISEGHVLEDRTLAPGGFYQYNGILNTARITNGYVRVERVEGRAPFYAYGVINDQENSDGSFVFPVGESSLVGTFRHILPVIVETGEFTSELTVTNLSGEAKLIHFDFVADEIGTDNHTASFTLTLEAGEQRIIADFIDTELRRKGVEGVGPTRGGLAGGLSAWDLFGDDPGGIVVGARTGAPDGSGGQYGVFYNAVPSGAAFTDSAWIYGLQQNGENRSNLALVNTGGPYNMPSTFEIDVYDGNGDSQPRTLSVTVGPHRWYQFNGILGKTSQGYVHVRKVSGNNPFLAYGVVNDGGTPGQRSGDGAYLPARE